MPKWRNKINVKQYLTDDSSDESVKLVASKIIPQLQRVYNRESKAVEGAKEGTYKDDLEYYLDELERLIEEFNWIVDAIDEGTAASEFDFNDWCEVLNEYLGQLYDLGDSVVQYNSHFDQEKYLWLC